MRPVRVHTDPGGLRYEKVRGAFAEACVATYSINWKFATHVLERCTAPVKLVIHSDFLQDAIRLKTKIRNSGIQIRLNPKTHMKLVIIDNEIAHVSTANFSMSDWFEVDVEICDPTEVKKLCKYFQLLWKDSTKI